MWNTTILQGGDLPGLGLAGSTRPSWMTTTLGGLPTPYATTVEPPSTANVTNATDIKKYLESYLGSQHRSVPESAILTIVYCLIFVTGVIGNVFTCIVITKNNYMHTATNYYLFSLAISDVMTLIIGK